MLERRAEAARGVTVVYESPRVWFSSPKPGFGLSKRKLGKLDVKISETKADLIRWMFVFWMGQIGARLGILFAFFRK